MNPEIAEVLEGKRRWTVVEGDNAEILPTLPDKSVAHVITDPPYDAHTHANARTNRGGRGAVAAAINFDSLLGVEFVAEFLRATTRWVIAFCSMEQLGDYKRAAGASWIRAGVWDRPDGMPQISGDRPAQGAEGIAIMHAAGRKRWNGGGGRALWTCGLERNDRAHPTQKPIGLMVELLEDFTDPGDLILDPFCGSGTTLVAALRLGRRAIGVERDPNYAAIARERCEAEARGLSLTAARVGQLPMFGGSR